MQSFFVTIFFLLFLFTPLVHAQEASFSADMELTPSPTPAVEYVLPYPGILPDNPLYIFKVVRDNFIGFLITDPLKKAEFDLLQADKRLQAGVALLAENPPKVTLAEVTISKGENYFFDAIGKAKQAKTGGMLVQDFLLKLRTAARKHDQTLVEESATLHENDKRDMLLSIKRIKNFEQTLDTLTNK